MRFKTNLVLLVLVVALGAFLYFDLEGDKEEQKKAEKAKELLSFAESDPRRLTVERGDTTIILEKTDSGWALIAPVEDAADQAVVESYLRNLRESVREKVIVDSADAVGNPEVGAPYGLDAPRLKILLETGSGAFDSLLFGDDTPTESYTYVQQRGDNPEILAIKPWRFDNLNKGLFDLRDRRVLPFEKAEVEEVRLASASGRIVLAKEGAEGWLLKEPVESPAIESEVDGLLNRLKSANAESFVAEEADSETLDEFGLAPITTLEVSLLVGEERAEKRLRIGGSIEGGDYYARDLSSPQVFLVDSSLVSALQKGADELRDKKPVKFATDEVTRIEMEKAGLKLTAEKDTAGVWTIVMPERREAKSWKLNSLLTDLAQIEVEEFAAEKTDDLARFGLKEPALRIRLNGMEGELVEALLGEDGGGNLYLMLGGAPQVYRIDAELLGDLNLGLDDVAQAPPREEPAAVDGAAGEGG
jgi:hypothetical protein